MNTEQKLTKAKKNMIRGQAFFAQIALGCMYVVRQDIPTMATDGDTIFYNPSFVEEMSLKDLEFVVCHEAMHIACLHPYRKGNRDHVKWNIACDYVVNQFLVEAGLSVPEGGLLDEQYKGLDTETVYNMLPDNICQKVFGSSGQPGDGNKMASAGQVIQPEGCDASELADKEAETKIRVVQAANVAKARGTLPACFEGMITEILEAKVPWQEVLAQFLTRITRNDYSWKMPNSRYAHTGIYLPSLGTPEIGDIAMIIDTSGSVSQEEMNEFNAEVQEICQGMTSETTIIYVDTRVQDIQKFEDGDTLEPPQGGGTCFKPGFEWIEENSLFPSCAIYLTDGYCDSYAPQPEYPVMWAVSRKIDFQPPYGQVIYLDQ